MSDQPTHEVTTLAHLLSLVTGRALRAACGERMSDSRPEAPTRSPRCPWCASGKRIQGQPSSEHAHETTWAGELLALVLRKPLTAICGFPLEEPLLTPPQPLCARCFPEPPPSNTAPINQKSNTARSGVDAR